MTVANIVAAIDRRAPFSKAASWDPVGLQIGDPTAAVERIALCHEVTAEVVEAVETEDVDLLVSYHPLLFRPVDRLISGSDPPGLALRLAQLATSLVVAHTNYDVAPGGSADALAEVLGLEDAKGFGPLDGPEQVKFVTFVPEPAAPALLEAVAAAGAGEIGLYTHCSFQSAGFGTFRPGVGANPTAGAVGKVNHEPELRVEFVAGSGTQDAVAAALVAAHPYEEPAYDVFERKGDARMIGRVGRVAPGTTVGSLAERVRSALDPPPVRIAGDPGRALERVAVVPGAGADFLAQARAAGADALVTGDLTHHRAQQALRMGLALVDPSHAATERPGLEALLAMLAVLGVECVNLLDLRANPWES